VFAVLSVEEFDRGRIKSLLHRVKVLFSGAEVITTEIYEDKINYFLISTEPVRGQIDWAKVAYTAGRESGSLIIPENIVMPPGCPVKRYDCNNFLRHVFIGTIMGIIKTSGIRPRDVNLGIYDPDALCPDTAISALSAAGTVKVVTGRLEKYTEYSHKAMDMYGAGLIVSPFVDSFYRCDIIMAPFGLDGCEYIPSGALVFDQQGLAGFSVSKECIILPKYYADMVPKGVCHADFAAVLFDRIRDVNMFKYRPHFLTKDGAKASIYKILEDFSALKNKIRA